MHLIRVDSRENSEERTEPYSPFPEPEVLCTIGGEDFTICNFKIEQEFAEIEPSSDSGPEEISLKLKSREYAEPALPKKGTNCNSNNEIIIEQIETLNNDTSQVGQAPRKKGKNKNSDNQVILEQLQTIKNNISTVSNDRTDSEVFGEYVSCLMNKIPPRERIECEFEIVKILKEKILQNSERKNSAKFLTK